MNTTTTDNPNKGAFDQAAYEALLDPDAHANTANCFDWGEPVQAELLGILLKDRKFLAQGGHLVEAKFFTNKAHRRIAQALLKFWRNHKTLPSKAILKDEITKGIDPQDTLFYLTALQCLLDVEPFDGRAYYLERLTNFVRVQSMKFTIGDIIDKMATEEPDYEAMLKRMAGIVSLGAKVDHGLDYFATIEDRYNVEENEDDIFTTGLKSLDELFGIGGLKRGCLYSVMACSGVGKSLLLSQMAMRNVLRGRRVLLISCEMAEVDIAKRLDSLLSKVGLSSLNLHTDTVKAKVKEVGETLDTTARPLILKQYPAGTCAVEDVRALLEGLATEGWTPDMVIFDYVGEMKLSKVQKRYEALEGLVSDLRGLATEFNFCGLTAMQPNRDALKAQDEGVIDASQLGDSFGQIRPLDSFWTLNQSAAEKDANVGRLWVEKNRDGRAKEKLHLEFDPLTMEIREIQPSTYGSRMSNRKEKLVESATDKGFFGKYKPKGKNTAGEFPSFDDLVAD